MTINSGTKSVKADLNTAHKKGTDEKNTCASGSLNGPIFFGLTYYFFLTQLTMQPHFLRGVSTGMII